MRETIHQIKSYTAQRLGQIAHASAPVAKATLARLRHGVGKTPGALPELWGSFLQELPPELYSATGEPSRAEWAIYTALTLYALHQQGRDPKTEPMHRAGESLGKAASKLAGNDEEERQRVWRRFQQIALADSMEAVSHYLRGLIQLLRANGIPLDYTALAADLYLYQNPAQTDRVRLRWGQDFYRVQPSETEETTNATGGNEHE